MHVLMPIIVAASNIVAALKKQVVEVVETNKMLALHVATDAQGLRNQVNRTWWLK